MQDILNKLQQLKQTLLNANSLAHELELLAQEEPSVIIPDDPTPPSTSEGEVYKGSVVSGKNYVIRDLQQGIYMRGISNVTIEITGELRNLELEDCANVRVFNGKLGKVHAHTPVKGLTIDGVTMDGGGTGSSFDIRGVNISLLNIKASVSRYGIWCDNSSNVTVDNCSFSTEGIQACTRFVNCHDVMVRDCVLSSDYKHCFRVHEISSNIRVLGTVMSGKGNGVMMGGPSNEVEGVIFSNCRFDAEGPDLFNVKEGVSNLDIQRCSFLLRHGWNPLEYLNADKKDNVLTFVTRTSP